MAVQVHALKVDCQTLLSRRHLRLLQCDRRNITGVNIKALACQKKCIASGAAAKIKGARTVVEIQTLEPVAQEWAWVPPCAIAAFPVASRLSITILIDERLKPEESALNRNCRQTAKRGRAIFTAVSIALAISSDAQAQQRSTNPSKPCESTAKTEWQTALIYDDAYLRHNPGESHPERPQRVTAIMEQLRANDIWARLIQLPAKSASDDALKLVHTDAYLKELQTADAQAPVNLDADTVLGIGSLDVAKRGAGAALAAVDALMSGTADRVFIPSRPPGHHAFADRASGFCFFNNVAIAARYAQSVHDIERVLIVDWDVHHGNATQDIFYNDSTVMYFSTHQYPHYPFTGLIDEVGEGPGRGSNFNVPLPAGSGGDEVLAAYEEILLPEAQKFKPELVLISAGFDSHAGDPLAHFQLTADDFKKMTEIVAGIAADSAKGRVISVLEGGYNLKNLAAAVESHIETLMAANDCR